MRLCTSRALCVYKSLLVGIQDIHGLDANLRISFQAFQNVSDKHLDIALSNSKANNANENVCFEQVVTHKPNILGPIPIPRVAGSPFQTQPQSLQFFFFINQQKQNHKGENVSILRASLTRC